MNVFLITMSVLAVSQSAKGKPEDSEAYTTIKDATNKFSTTLYQSMSSQPGNLTVSPVSAAAVLALTWLGAEGTTAQEIAKALNLPSDRKIVMDGFRELMDTLQGGDKYVLKVANKIYVQNSFHIKDDFQKKTKNSFKIQAEEVNFSNDTENVRLIINKWVQQTTGGRIKELITQGSIGSDTCLLLVNAIYFRAGWLRPFETSETKTEPFHISESSQTNVEMMNGNIQLDYGRISHLNATAVSLPYVGDNNLEMVIILPDSIDGLDKVEEGLGELNLSNITPQFGDVHISLPKFKIETKNYLREQLTKVGVKEVFGSSADLSKLSDGKLYVSEVVQNTLINVDEKGTEAAATTGINIQLVAIFEKVEFNANHPFLFVLRKSGIIFFIGRVTDPSHIGTK